VAGVCRSRGTCGWHHMNSAPLVNS
jgi:hypothetical protein